MGYAAMAWALFAIIHRTIVQFRASETGMHKRSGRRQNPGTARQLGARAHTDPDGDHHADAVHLRCPPPKSAGEFSIPDLHPEQPVE